MDVSSFVAAIRGRLGFIVLLGVATGLVAFVASTQLPKTYDAEADVFVGSLVDAEYDQLLAYQQLAQAYAQLATTRPVLSRVIASADLDETVEELDARLDVRAPTGLSIVRIVASAPTAVEAAAVANAVADEIVTLSDPPGLATPALATVVQPAVPPRSPSSPQVLLNTLVAGALGLALGLAVALLLGQRRTTSATTASVPAAGVTSPGT